MSTPAAFIGYLERTAAQNPAKAALLRRSLAFEPGADLRTFGIVEAQVPLDQPWARSSYYLVAGLWASVHTASVLADNRRAVQRSPTHEDSATADTPPAEPVTERRRSFGQAARALYWQRAQTESIEQRFVALLDADELQLAPHLRHMVQLIKAEETIPIDWVQLLADVVEWSSSDRRVQQRWARDFYRALPADDAASSGNTTGNGQDGATSAEGA